MVLFIILSAGFMATNYLSNRIKNDIDAFLGAESTFREIDVDLFRQNIHILELNFKNLGTQISTPRLSFKGLSYFKYLKTQKFVINKVELIAPHIQLSAAQDLGEKGELKFAKEIELGALHVSNGTVELLEKNAEKSKLFLRFPKLEISEIKVDSSTISNKIPFTYHTYKLEADSLHLSINPEHYVALESIVAENNRVEVTNFEIIPYFGPSKFDQNIPYEKDRISLKVPNVSLDSLNFKFINDTLYLRNPVMRISGAQLQVYRNKTLADNPREIPLYSQILRRSPVKLDFEEINIDKTHIVYEEKVKVERSVARISFNNVEGKITNLLNISLEQKDFPRTNIHAKAGFMGVTPIQIDWSFNTTNPQDSFLFSGNFGSLSGDTMSAFLKPSMGLTAEGMIKGVAFTFNGNNEILKGDVQVEYDNFRIEILKDNGRDKNKLLSALANLFVDNDGLSEKHNRKDIKVKRDQTKSFWNFVWLGLKQGILDALVQIR